MPPSPRTGRRQSLKTAVHSFGTVVAITLLGILTGVLTGTGLGMADDIDGIATSGWIGAAVGGVAVSGTLAVSAFLKGFRRKLVAAAERVGRYLNCLAVLGGCSIAFDMYVTKWGAAPFYNLVGEIVLGITWGVTAGVAASVALGLIVGLLTVFSLAVVVLVRMLAGFVHSARKGPESVPADLISGACDPWPIRTAAALMPPEAGRRWRDDFNEARYDHENDQHTKLLRDFLVHAPAVVVWAWIATVQHRVLGVRNPQERRW